MGSTEPPEPAHSFAVYALSRGKGVPEATAVALQRADAILRSVAAESGVRVSRTRIGLEGEIRLCAEFEQPAVGRRVFDEVREVVEGVELINLVEEPCPPGEERELP